LFYTVGKTLLGGIQSVWVGDGYDCNKLPRNTVYGASGGIVNGPQSTWLSVLTVSSTPNGSAFQLAWNESSLISQNTTVYIRHMYDATKWTSWKQL